MKLIDQAVTDGLMTPEQAAEFRRGTIGQFDWGILQTGHDPGCRAIIEAREGACTCEPWAIFMAAPGTTGAGIQWWWLGDHWSPRDLLTDAEVQMMVETMFRDLIGSLFSGALPGVIWGKP